MTFDVTDVANAINNQEASGSAQDEEIDDEMELEEEDEFENDFDAAEDEERMPFMLNIKATPLAAESQSKGSLTFDVEVLSSLEASDKYELFISDMSLQSGQSAPSEMEYRGPMFETLDDGIREAADAFVSKNFRKFVPLIADYAQCEEANLYSKWLEDLSSIVSH